MHRLSRHGRVLLPLVALIFCCRTESPAQSATIIFPFETTTNFVLNVTANQAVKLHYNLPEWGVYLTKDATTVSLWPAIYVDRRPLIAQGPLTLEFKATNTVSTGTLTYQIVPSEGLITKVHPSAAGTDISVPAGKILRILDMSNPSPSLSYELKSAGGVVSPQGNLFMDSEAHHAFFVVGPLTFTVKSAFDTGPAYISYYFAEDVAQLPAGAIQVSGHSNIVIEKSTDLSNWTSAGIIPAPAEAKAFYRLKAAQ